MSTNMEGPLWDNFCKRIGAKLSSRLDGEVVARLPIIFKQLHLRDRLKQLNDLEYRLIDELCQCQVDIEDCERMIKLYEEKGS